MPDGMDIARSACRPVRKATAVHLQEGEGKKGAWRSAVRRIGAVACDD